MEIQFNRNLPVNELETAQTLNALGGIADRGALVSRANQLLGKEG